MRVSTLFMTILFLIQWVITGPDILLAQQTPQQPSVDPTQNTPTKQAVQEPAPATEAKAPQEKTVIL